MPFKSSYPDRGTHVPRPRYTCIPTEVHMYPDRGTITLKPVSHEIKVSGRAHLLVLYVALSY